MIVLTVLHLALGSQCGSGPQAPIELDPSLLRDWSQELRPPCPAPYSATFTRGEKTLVFIAAKHGPEGQNPTHQLIDFHLKDRPEFVVLEGVPTLDPTARETIMNASRDCLMRGGTGCSESPYLGLKSAILAIPWVGGEPMDQKILSDMVSQGVTPMDVIGLQFLHYLAQQNRDQRPIDPHVLRRIGKDFGVAVTPEDIKGWYAKLNGRDLDPRRVGIREVTPLPPPLSSPTQQLAWMMDQTREVQILDTVEQALAQHDHVLITYGQGHLQKQQLALEQALGPARIRCQ